MSTMRRVISACFMVGLASSEAAPPSHCIASTEDPSSCITPTDDATILMQQKIRVHKGKKEAGDAGLAINCRVIGATKLMTETQTTAAAEEMIISGCTRVDWDGDGIKPGCFAEAIGKWKASILKRKGLPEDAALPDGYSAHPHCAHTTMTGPPGDTHLVTKAPPGQQQTTGFFNEWGCDLPPEDQVGWEAIEEAEKHIDTTLGAGANEKVGQYLRLAVADYHLNKPKFVFWLLEEDRCQAEKELSDWVSLAEYKALKVCAGCQADAARWVIIDKCGKQVTPANEHQQSTYKQTGSTYHDRLHGHQAMANTCTATWNNADAAALGWAAGATTETELSQPKLKEDTVATTCAEQ